MKVVSFGSEDIKRLREDFKRNPEEEHPLDLSPDSAFRAPITLADFEEIRQRYTLTKLQCFSGNHSRLACIENHDGLPHSLLFRKVTFLHFAFYKDETTISNLISSGNLENWRAKSLDTSKDFSTILIKMHDQAEELKERCNKAYPAERVKSEFDSKLADLKKMWMTEHSLTSETMGQYWQLAKLQDTTWDLFSQILLGKVTLAEARKGKQKKFKKPNSPSFIRLPGFVTTSNEQIFHEKNFWKKVDSF